MYSYRLYLQIQTSSYICMMLFLTGELGNLNHDSHISRESVQVVRSSGIASDLSDADMTHCPINELQKPF
jgi:hypothetical protein